VPDYAPDRIVLCGNIPTLGSWVKHTYKLKKIHNRLYKAYVFLSQKRDVEFKVTLGGWDTVQKDSDFKDVGNFQVFEEQIEDGKSYSFTVDNFNGFQEGGSDHSRVGDFKFIHKFPSTILGRNREILVYLPPDYKSSKKDFPLLIMHDGNNLFDKQTAFLGNEWKVDEVMQKLHQEGQVKGVIIAGVYNSINRMKEYTPVKDTEYGGGEGKKYLDFLTQELMPELHKTFRIKKGPKNTGVMGSSLGGLISLYAGFEYSNYFGMVGAISPSLWWSNRYMESFVQSKNKPKIKLWLDMGTQEGLGENGESKPLKDARSMDSLLRSIGFTKPQQYQYFEHRGGTHSEKSWSQRLYKPMTFFFGKN
jgi:predicted alpha/beta superfamily hydrolase